MANFIKYDGSRAQIIAATNTLDTFDQWKTYVDRKAQATDWDERRLGVMGDKLDRKLVQLTSQQQAMLQDRQKAYLVNLGTQTKAREAVFGEDSVPKGPDTAASLFEAGQEIVPPEVKDEIAKGIEEKLPVVKEVFQIQKTMEDSVRKFQNANADCDNDDCRNSVATNYQIAAGSLVSTINTNAKRLGLDDDKVKEFTQYLTNGEYTVKLADAKARILQARSGCSPTCDTVSEDESKRGKVAPDQAAYYQASAEYLRTLNTASKTIASGVEYDKAIQALKVDESVVDKKVAMRDIQLKLSGVPDFDIANYWQQYNKLKDEIVDLKGVNEANLADAVAQSTGYVQSGVEAFAACVSAGKISCETDPGVIAAKAEITRRMGPDSQQVAQLDRKLYEVKTRAEMNDLYAARLEVAGRKIRMRLRTLQ